MVPQVAAANWGVPQAEAAQRTEQNVRHRGEPQAQLVGLHRCG
jgi:hypothetical protein